MSAIRDPGYWYENRSQLKSGMVFRDYEGTFVKLDRHVPGDGTDWYAEVWYPGTPNAPGYEKGRWICDDHRLHPSDLRGDPIEGMAA